VILVKAFAGSEAKQSKTQSTKSPRRKALMFPYAVVTVESYKAKDIETAGTQSLFL
jgi:hypothetical protein